MQISVKNQPGRILTWTQYVSNPSVWTLLATNLLIIIWAVVENWSVFVLMWIYWAQSVGIGILWFFKILSLKQYSTANFKINNSPVEPGLATKIKVLVFFPVHYGGFHLIYALFFVVLSAFLPGYKPVEPRPVVIAGAIFLVNQLFSFLYNLKNDRAQKPNIGRLMSFPYFRIAPMHITIVSFAFLQFKGLGADSHLFLVLFLLLKTAADVTMHIKQLHGFADKPAPVGQVVLT